MLLPVPLTVPVILLSGVKAEVSIGVVKLNCGNSLSILIDKGVDETLWFPATSVATAVISRTPSVKFSATVISQLPSPEAVVVPTDIPSLQLLLTQ